MKNIKAIGIDLAKNVFQLHGVDVKGKRVLSKRLKRSEFKKFMEELPPCIVGMEACGGAQYWARILNRKGHTVRMMAPQFVRPYRKSNKKNDANDAEAIAEAMMRPNMRFVPLKTQEQQDIQGIHRVREQLIKQRTAQVNQVRGLLAEYGIVIDQSIGKVCKQLPLIIEDAENELSMNMREVFQRLYFHLKALDEEVALYDEKLQRLAQADERCRRLMEIEGVGVLTATAAVASLGDGRAFKRGREVSAWLGLVPRQSSSGNQTKLLGIGKRSDSYLRTLLIHGARSVVRVCDRKKDGRSLWIQKKKAEHGANKAAVALANKNARILWALLAKEEKYRPGLAV